jgi:peptidoglycan/LPS O-acetylase OafA/YrhL
MVDRNDKASDNFNLARLCLACLVIISHAPELLDGNRSRELLTQTFHTISFGEFAVDGFFIVSGYLITASYQGTDSTSVFLFKRIARIYPGFCVAWLVCLLLIAPLSGAALWPWHLLASEQLFFGMFLLQGPRLPDAFHGLHYPVLDGAMWTIPYEFRCYLLVALAGRLGLLACRKWVFAAALSVLAGSTATQIGWLHPSLPPAFFLATLDPVQFLRLFGCFAMGMCLFLFRDRISYTYTSLWFASFLLFLMMRQPGLADLGVATAGAYLLIFLARAPNVFGSRRFFLRPLFVCVADQFAIHTPLSAFRTGYASAADANICRLRWLCELAVHRTASAAL